MKEEKPTFAATTTKDSIWLTHHEKFFIKVGVSVDMVS
jgi:hypothetical protein